MNQAKAHFGAPHCFEFAPIWIRSARATEGPSGRTGGLTRNERIAEVRIAPCS